MTERDVRAVAGSSRLILPDRAIVTPAARDLARQLGVVLQPPDSTQTGGSGVQGAESARSNPAAPPTPHVPLPIPRGGDGEGARGRVVAVGSDHGGFPLKEHLKTVIPRLGWEVRDVGCESAESVDYPVYAARVADAVAYGDAAFGIMVDGAGIGSAMVANKIPGARAALCYDLTTAQNAREHNNANILTLGGTLIGTRLASEIVRVFLATPFGGGRHQRRVAMIDALDEPRS